MITEVNQTFILILVLSFAGAFLAAGAVLSWPLLSRVRVRRSLDRLNTYDSPVDTEPKADSNFLEQVIWPFVDVLGRLSRRWTNEQRLARVQRKLTYAGIRSITPEKFVAVKLAVTAAGALLYLLLLLPWLFLVDGPVWLGLILIPVSYFLPDAWLDRKIRARQRLITITLADTVDIITIGIQAGLAFNAAVTKVVKNMEGPLSEELGRMLGELQIGKARRDALKNLSERTTVSELKKFCSTIIQADQLGISISKILKNESKEMRERRRQHAEEEAMKTPVKMVFPIVIFILPALMLVIVGPGVIRIVETLF